MKMLVLGAGLQGSSCAYNLLQDNRIESVTIADLHPEGLPAFLAPWLGGRLQTAVLDAKDSAGAAALMEGHTAVMCALPYYFNEPMTRAAIASGAHFCDLGGNTAIVQEQKALHSQAKAAGVSVIPDCGLAPGMVNILAAEGIRRLDQATTVRIYVGGLPQHPEPPLNYQIVYSLEGALDYYTTPSWVLRNGKAVEVDALSELEEVDFPDPVGRLEAFHTGGGISTMPFAWEGKIDTMEYKTLRYPGHVAIMKPIRELGLISNDPIDVKGQQVRPRDLFIAATHPMLYRPESEDLVALRVTVDGTKDGKAARSTFELVDRFDTAIGMSAMMRTTGFSLALTGIMQADGTIAQFGVHTPDEATPYQPYVEGLRQFGVEIREG
ncbi:MAG: saccharopine dehydrogenase C-terminal domain-containing protein [Gemmatimonadota bacterium]|mgnify:CR=1 FL=1|nr:saccharopine dehydrogenase C-terminal domain-containing protein [Gemmatimonadota bacterium]